MSRIIRIDEIMRMYRHYVMLYLYAYSFNTMPSFAKDNNISLKLANRIIQIGRLNS